MPSDQPTLPTVIREAIESAMVGVHTAMPGTVTSYDPTLQRADVEPGFRRVIRRADGERVSEALPVIPSVPVAFLGAGGVVFAPPIDIGATGLLLFAEYSIDKWRQQGGQGDPGDARRHGLSGAVFYPGLQIAGNPFAPVSNKHAVITIPAGQQLLIGSNGSDEPFVLGKSYRTAEDQFFDDMINNVTLPTSPSLATAGAQLVVAGGQPAWNPAVQTALTAAGNALIGISTYLATFQGSAADYLSDKIKGEK